MNILTPLEEFVLLALLAAGETGLTASGIAKALRPLSRFDAAAVKEACGRCETLGLADKPARKPRARTDHWRINGSGREAAGRLFEGRRGRGWLAKATRQRVAAHALGLDDRAAAAVAADDDALAACLLAARLGWKFEPGTTARSLALDVAAQDLEAANTQPATLWQALLRRAVSSVAATAHDEPFAAQIARAARLAPADAWFGPRKLFIHRAWEMWRRLTDHPEMDLAAFKARLLSAVRAGELGLTRADFPDAIAPGDLAAAETRYGTEISHFITAEHTHTS